MNGRKSAAEIHAPEEQDEWNMKERVANKESVGFGREMTEFFL